MTALNPKFEALVEPVAKAICEASSQSWREGILNGPGMGMRPADPLNNHWRYKARVVLATLAPHIERMLAEARKDEAEQCARVAEAMQQALFKVLAYDQLLRKIGEAGEHEILFEGTMPAVDAVYDDMVATVVAALRARHAGESPDGR